MALQCKTMNLSTAASILSVFFPPHPLLMLRYKNHLGWFGCLQNCTIVFYYSLIKIMCKRYIVYMSSHGLSPLPHLVLTNEEKEEIKTLSFSLCENL